MRDRAIFRLRDMKKSIDLIKSSLLGKTLDDIQGDPVLLAAFERFLEVLSEAARHVPEAWREERPEIPWRRVADLGNHVRHEYFRVDVSGLWSIYLRDIEPLEQAVDALLAKHDR